MQPETNKISSSRKLPKVSVKKLGTLLLIIVVLAGAFGGYYWLKHKPVGLRAYSFRYTQLNSYNLKGDQKGSGIMVSKPTEIGTSGSSADKTSQINFKHTISKNNQVVIVAQLAMASVNIGSEFQAEYLKNIDTAMGDTKNTSHSIAQKPIQSFVNQRLDPAYTATYTEPKSLTTTNLKTHSWYLGFTATAKDKTKFPDISGKVLVTPGKTTYYYFMVDSLTINWQKNQKVWDQVLNSIKIDQ